MDLLSIKVVLLNRPKSVKILPKIGSHNEQQTLFINERQGQEWNGSHSWANVILGNWGLFSPSSLLDSEGSQKLTMGLPSFFQNKPSLASVQFQKANYPESHTIPTVLPHLSGLGFSVSSYHSGKCKYSYSSWTGNPCVGLMATRRSSCWEMEPPPLLKRFHWFLNCKHSPLFGAPKPQTILSGHKRLQGYRIQSQCSLESGNLLGSPSNQLRKGPKVLKFQIMCETERSPELFLQLTVGVPTLKIHPRHFSGSQVGQEHYEFLPQTHNGICFPRSRILAPKLLLCPVKMLRLPLELTAI